MSLRHDISRPARRGTPRGVTPPPKPWLDRCDQLCAASRDFPTEGSRPLGGCATPLARLLTAALGGAAAATSIASSEEPPSGLSTETNWLLGHTWVTGSRVPLRAWGLRLCFTRDGPERRRGRPPVSEGRVGLTRPTTSISLPPNGAFGLFARIQTCVKDGGCSPVVL